jgi:hypothetical protein
MAESSFAQVIGVAHVCGASREAEITGALRKSNQARLCAASAVDLNVDDRSPGVHRAAARRA